MKRKNIFFSHIFLLISFFTYFSFLNSYIYASENSNTDINATSLELHCNSDIAMDFDSGNVLYNNNATKKIYPASTTKILTCILAIENLELTDTTVVSKKVIQNTPYDSSVMGVKSGELYTIEELLYGLMLPSGNDAALVLAEAVSNSTSAFVELMNQKVKELGCINTNFTNPHGYHDDNHYSTAYDMATIFKYCLKNETFRKIIGTTEFTAKAANSDTELKLKNSNRMQNPDYTKTYYEYMKGGKTGYTLEARGTFIGYGIKNDKTVIVGAFDGSQNINGSQGRFLDARNLLEYSFENYSKQLILNANDYTFQVYDDKNGKCYTIKSENDAYGLVKEIPNIEYTMDINHEEFDKILLESKENYTNKIVGNIDFIYNFKNNETEIMKTSNISNTQNLILIDISDYMTQNDIHKMIFSITVILIILLFLLYLINKNKTTKRKKYKINYKYNFYN